MIIDIVITLAVVGVIAGGICAINLNKVKAPVKRKTSTPRKKTVKKVSKKVSKKDVAKKVTR